tara:strand:+ start:1429 stop:3558 length:2130 start_codon:yes stop_codon:yes gene_type:complete
MRIIYIFIKALLALVLVWPNFSFAGNVTMPSSLVADTSTFVTLSDSGTTPSISGYTGTLLVSVTASDGNIKVTTTTNLKRASGYCGYSSDSDDEPTDCSGNSLTEIGFRGTQDDINTALATLAFKGDGTTGSPTVTLSVTPAGSLYNSANGHYYKVVNHGSSITWSAAKTAAEASTFNGLSGYLASITSSSENTFIDEKAGVNAWLGGTDRDSEGCWKWSGGPDDGKIFTVGNDADNTTSGGCTVDSGYTVYEKPFGDGEFGWNSNEPNDAGGEDRLHIKTDGSWNDFANGNTNVSFYVIEYGGMPGETATTTGLTTLTIKSVEASESTYNAFDDKQLKGIVEAHNESIKNSLTQSTNSILRRMEQYRRFENNQSFKIQDLKFVFNDRSSDGNIEKRLIEHYSKEIIGKMKIKDYTASYLANLMSNNSDAEYDNWVWWASGSINKGSLNFKSDQLGRQTDTTGFVIGADIDYDNNSLLGFAFRNDDITTSVSTDGTKSTSRGQNLMMYHTLKINNQNYFDSFFGIGRTDQHTDRVVDIANDINVVGLNEARHVFGAFKYNFSNDLKIFNISNYSQFNFGYSEIDGYTEKGSSNSKMSFDDRDLLSSSATIGMKINRSFDLNNSDLLPHLKLDYNEDLTEDSVLKGNLVSVPSNQYSTTISKHFSSSIRFEAGFDWIFDNGWNVTSIFNRLEKDGFGHENALIFSAYREF